MSRPMAAVVYVAVAGGVSTALASLTACLFPASVQGLVWVVVALATVSMAGALTPHWANPYTTRTSQEGDQ